MRLEPALRFLVRVCGILAAVGAVGIAVGLVLVTITLFKYGVDRDSWWRYGLFYFFAAGAILRWRSFARLIRYALLGFPDDQAR